jgi:hypothetical protein
MLSATDLAAMRLAQAEALPGTCTILRATSAHNAIGEMALTWQTVGTAVPCRLRPQTRIGDLRSIGGQQQLVGQWVVTLAYGANVCNGDRIVIGGDTYEVIATQQDEDWLTATRCEVRRID